MIIIKTGVRNSRSPIIAQSREQLVEHSVRALIRRFHLNRDWIIGLIDDRGSGKSLGGANIAIRDFMMSGEPCWSNMQIRLNVEVSDDIARCYGLDGGMVVYAAEHIDKQGFLALDSRYEGGCLFFDEFNLEYGEARRSSANVNLMTDRAIQQLRKLQCGLVYTVLNEMYVDSRIRENTDVFIRCSDVAFNPMNMMSRMKQGVEFGWKVYAMSSKLEGNGKTYAETHRTQDFNITMGDMWGIIDTYERQAIGATKYTETKKLIPLQMGEDPVVVKDRDKWGWLDKNLTRFFERHAEEGDVIEISSSELRQELGVEKGQWGYVVSKLYERLPDMEGTGKGTRANPTKFKLNNRVLV